jgi:hypothetical protein
MKVLRQLLTPTQLLLKRFYFFSAKISLAQVRDGVFSIGGDAIKRFSSSMMLRRNKLERFVIAS